MANKYCLINAIVNIGNAQKVVEAANKAGARGATIINAHGSGSKEAQLLLGVNITPEKEKVLLIVDRKIKDDVLKAIAIDCGLNTEGQGIVYSIDVDNVIGIK